MPLNNLRPNNLRRNLGLAMGLGVCSALCVSACLQAPVDRRPPVLISIAQHAALEPYTEFGADAEMLVQALESVCAQTDAGTVETAREAWDAARAPWKRAELVKFGPVVEYPERLGPKIDDWPANTTAIEELVASDESLTGEAFSAFGTTTRGLPVIEYLLWASGETTAQEWGSQARRCELALGAAIDLRSNSDLLVREWEERWFVELTDPDNGTGAYKNLQEVLDEWVNRMVFTVENIRVEKLGKPLGDESGGLPQPDTVESRFSGRSLRDAQDALQGVASVWSGWGEDAPGLRALVGSDDLAARIDAAFAKAVAALADVPEPFAETIELAPERVAEAQTALQELQVLLQVELTQALGVKVSFNDNDGD